MFNFYLLWLLLTSIFYFGVSNSGVDLRNQVKERDEALADLEDQLKKLKSELETRDEEIDRLIQLQNELDRKVNDLAQENKDQGKNICSIIFISLS